MQRILSVFGARLVIGIIFLKVATVASHATPADSVIFKAIVDEVERNLHEIQYKDFSRPFYISFTLEDIHTVYVDASFGAIVNCREKKDRSWANRVLCGNYELNDENYYDATRTKAQGDGTLSLPLDSDYWGIRRAIWLIINNTYKSAAQTYQNKIEALKEKNFPHDSLEIPDFAKAPTVHLFLQPQIQIPPIDSIKSLVRDLSNIFNNKKHISYSNVSYYQIHAKIYFYSSENSRIIFPLDYTVLNIGVLSELDGETVSDALTYLERNPSKIFMQKSSIIANIDSISSKLETKVKASYVKENYYGPVLFFNQAAVQAWLQGLFGYPDNLFAYREPLYNASNKTLYYGQNMNSLETKINKPVIDKNISIYDAARLTHWQETELFGWYPVDAEGVIPIDSLVLFDNGILKTLYNGRTPTRSVPTSNGHQRFTFTNGAIVAGIGPGNMIIRANKTFSEEQLKKILLQKAHEQGLDYAYIVRPNLIGNFLTSLNLYQVDVATGSEKLVRGAMLKPITINTLRKNIAVSSNAFVYNGFLNENLLNIDGSSSISQNSIPDGTPISVICPSAMILEDIELTFYNKSLIDEKPIVPRPE
ncbi:MAG TPA: metallopeptidase TldD-related protein [Bacteroidales bacterium]|nr:metallopeptidase TldD-related protein [Bacteroidales bacterium]HPO65670.1 metallopeptidase TldD-related protein [Bacteroidales bacterium]